MKRLYFDYNATTPLAPSVKDLMVRLAQEDWMNPSSIHREGREARRALEAARGHMAGLLDCAPKEVVFTSGATEASNLVLQSVWETRPAGKNKIITTAVEHDAVLKPLKKLAARGAEVIILPVDGQGQPDLNRLGQELDEKALLVSMMLANNETGIGLPVVEAWRLAKSKGVLFHSDAACYVGKSLISFRNLGVDFLTFSGHKFYAPKGIGAVLVSQGVPWEPGLLGGSHEMGRRAGTENLYGILAMAEALEYALTDLDVEVPRLAQLRDVLKTSLQKFWPAVQFNEHPRLTLTSTLSASFPGIDGQTLLARLDLEGVAVSAGSACHSGSLDMSRVLKAMGLPDELAGSTLRLSFGRMTTSEDIHNLVKVFEKVLGEMAVKKGLV